MMPGDELASPVVWTLSQYLSRKAEVGALFDAHLEGLLSLLDAKLSDPYSQEILARFTTNPSDPVEAETLRLHLAREIVRDADFGQQLSASLGGHTVDKPPPPGRRKRWVTVGTIGVLVVAALVAGFVVARSTGPDPAAASAPITVTKPVDDTPTSTPTTTTTTSAPSASATSSAVPAGTLTAGQPGAPGDGSTLSKGTPVFITDLPRPNNDWKFEHGDHDVQLTQFTESVWNYLSTCDTTRYGGEQQFRMKSFSKFEAKAVGTDSTADPGLAVKFEVFVNNDNIHPVASLVMNPGEAKPLTADLPANTFALTLRSSLVTVDKSTCRRGNAVWGSPHVLASGS